MAAVLSTSNFFNIPLTYKPLQVNLRLVTAEVEESTQLHDIIQQRKLSALFQPIIDLSSGEFLGYEGLIRAPSDSTLHAPINLFAAAEQQGLSLEIEMLARQIVLESFAKQNLPGKLFLNVSPKALSQPNFKNGLTLEFMRALNLDPARVVIEITENQPTFDFQVMRDALLHYRAMGFKIAIDDLGEGFSTLRLWSELRPDFIKIDMHFVQGVDQDLIKLQFIKSIQAIAQSCGTQVIAEGVETAAELKIVKEIGIAFAQGYFIARPKPTPPMMANSETSRIIHAANVAQLPLLNTAQPESSSAQQLLNYIAAMSPEMSAEQVYARFLDEPTLRIIPVVKNGKPLGLINRYPFVECFARAELSDLYAQKTCRDLLKVEPLLVDKNMPIEELSQFLIEADNCHFTDGFIITEQGRYSGVASGQDVLRELAQRHVVAARYADPLTDLPGPVAINRHIERWLQNQSNFVACYVNLAHFKPFNARYGYAQGDELIQLTGRMLSWAVDLKQDFIGHMGGEDFVLLLQSRDWKTRCESALHSFAQASSLLFEDEHFAAAGYHHAAQNASLVFHPLPRLVIGAVKVTAQRFSSHHAVSDALSDAISMAKRVNSNSVFIERSKLAA